MTIGGIHLLDGQPGPGLVAEFHGDGLAVALRDVHSVDLIGPLVILRRGGLLDSILTGDEVGEHRPPIRPGGFGEGLSGLKRRGVGPQEGGLDGGPRQQLAGLRVLFQYDQLGLFIVGDI